MHLRQLLALIDKGAHWIGSAYAYVTEQFLWCVLGNPPTVLSGFREFDIARAPGGTEYMVVHDSRNTIRLLMSPAAGIGSTGAFTVPLGPFPAIPRPWYEWCPGTPTSNVAGGPTTKWKRVDTGPCGTPAFTGLGGSVVQPTIAVDGRGRLAITYYESNPAGVPGVNTPADTMLRVVFRGNLNPQDPTVGFDATPVTSFFTPSGFLGDYMAIAVRPTLSGALRPGCTEVNDFLPIWTQASPTGGGMVVATTGVQLFP